ncbi:hypothetical protein CDD83_382 [Cordyceps sp. RAO-2017]|nr:hypothetical protein CDD83_382 [Cordyceps sp. RAO-2017]
MTRGLDTRPFSPAALTRQRLSSSSPPETCLFESNLTRVRMHAPREIASIPIALRQMAVASAAREFFTHQQTERKDESLAANWPPFVHLDYGRDGFARPRRDGGKQSRRAIGDMQREAKTRFRRWLAGFAAWPVAWCQALGGHGRVAERRWHELCMAWLAEQTPVEVRSLCSDLHYALREAFPLGPRAEQSSTDQ